MKLRVGYELQYDFPQPTPVVLMLNIHFTRVCDLAMPDHIVVSPSVPVSGYRDGFGNWCTRFLAPTGRMLISADAVVRDTGRPDPVVSDARQVPVEELPEEALVLRRYTRRSQAWSCSGGERDETSGRLRIAIRLPATDTGHLDAEYPFHARFRPRNARPHRNQPLHRAGLPE